MSFDHTILKGTTSKIIEVILRDSSTGAGKTAVAYTDVTASYVREGGTRTALTLAAGTAGDAYSAGKWCEVDSTNCPGLYQLHLPNASLATGVDAVTTTLTATGVIDKVVRISLLDVDLRDATDAGLSNLDAAISTRSTVAATDIVSGGAITTSGGAVSNVTLVATTTTNSDMRGTDGANTVAPDNASIAAILVDTGTDIPASVAALNDFNPATDTVANVTTVGSVTNPVTTDAASRTASQADVSALATEASIAALNDLSSTDVTNAVWDASTSSHNLAGSFGRGFRQVKEGLVSIDGQVNDLSATTTSFVTHLAAAVDDFYNGQTLHFISGSLAGQSQVIRDYNGTTKTITLDSALTSAPANADEFIVLSTHVHSIAEIADSVWDEAQSGHTTVGTFGYYLDSQVSALATQASVDTIDVNVDAIKVKTDQLTFTNPNSVDATATADVDEAAIADAVIAGIGGTDVTISSVIAEDGTTITIVRGDDYSASDSRAITWTGTTDDQWPSLSGATLKFTAKNNMDSLTVTPTVTQPTGTQAFRMELTSTNTEIMSGRYKYDVQATLSSGRVITLVVGEMIVKQTYTDRP